MKATIHHIDTCLPCYTLRTHDIAIAVDGTTTVREVLDAMIDEVRCNGFQRQEDETLLTDAHYTAFGVEQLALREDNAARLDQLFMPSLEIDDGTGESVYAYFDVTFDTDG